MLLSTQLLLPLVTVQLKSNQLYLHRLREYFESNFLLRRTGLDLTRTPPPNLVWARKQRHAFST